MATTPGSIFNFSQDWKWITQHLVLLCVIAIATWGGVYEIESLIAKHDQATEARYSLILQQQTAQTQVIENQLKTDEANWTQLNTQLTAQNQQEQQQIAARDAQIQQLITKINQMQPPQLVADLQPKLHQGTATVLSDGVKLDTPAARDVDEQLTQAAATTADLTATKVEVTNLTQLVAKAQDTIDTANKAVGAEQAKYDAQVNDCQAQIKTVKDEAAKSKLKIGFWSFLGGILVKALIVIK